ncbi:hypothetical protein DL766_008729 [Monosporascus sp. MC13-8B]|nr:hypothetical protein DL763_000886 [Monosporascus cannonballus]RYP18184.1 hypothetical protein DL766_008729 [Monosporascus sp. MC13-8B]
MSSTQAVVNVIYPKEAASNFNMEYYIKTHMPLVQKIWGPLGLKSWTVSTVNPESGFHVQAFLVWDSLEAFEKAPIDEIFADVKNFTNVTPVKWVGQLHGHSTISS